MRDPSISIHFVNSVVHSLTANKTELKKILLKNNIPLEFVEQQFGRVSAKDFAGLTRDAMDFLNDELLGYGDGNQPPGCWQSMCQSVIGSKNIGEALKRFTQFYGLISWGLKPSILYHEDNVQFYLKNISSKKRFEPFTYELFFFYFHRFFNWLSGSEIVLKKIEFTFDKPVYFNEYRMVYPSCSEYVFNQNCASVYFSKTYLHLPIKQTEQTLHNFMVNPTYAMLVQYYDQRSWNHRVKKRIFQHLCDNPSLESLAHKFNISAQTLRRYLANEGIQYRELKMQVRRDAAIYYLRTKNFSVEQTAFLTGFSESSAFIRAFKGWTGVKPTRYRAIHKQ